MKPDRRSQLPEPVAWRGLDVRPPQHDWQQLIEDIGTEVFHAYGQRVSQDGDSAAMFSLGRSREVEVTSPLQIAAHHDNPVAGAGGGQLHGAKFSLRQHCGDDVLQVYVVETEGAVGPAVNALLSSMSDNLIAVDLEWIPDSSPAVSNPIAMLQLASSSCVLLVRVCRMQRRREMPAALSEVLRCVALGSDQCRLYQVVTCTPS